MSGQILGIPPAEWEYEFMAVKKLEDGNYQWVANYEDYPIELEGCAEGLIIVHNVRIAHKERRCDNAE